MPFNQVDSIRYFTFNSFTNCSIKHAILTIRGGISPPPWHSLNIGATVGDEQNRVEENRKKTFEVLGFDYKNRFDVWQVHGNDVVCADKPRAENEIIHKADAIITDVKHVTLLMRFADCVPILLYDTVLKVIGLVHAGWKGTVNRVAAKAVDTMCERYGTLPVNIMAGIGPSIGPDHYQIGMDVFTKVNETFNKDASGLLTTNRNQGKMSYHLNLWKTNKMVLEQAGVNKIEIASICTACNLDDWYSHRAENGKTGRFGALVAL
jgi:YfiH family protein